MSATFLIEARISFSEVPARFTSSTPSCTWPELLVIRSLMSLAACEERCARLRTSEATTAKPRPASPARAASTAALSASRLVCRAISSITPMMSEILREDSSIRDIALDRFARPPRRHDRRPRGCRPRTGWPAGRSRRSSSPSRRSPPSTRRSPPGSRPAPRCAATGRWCWSRSRRRRSTTSRADVTIAPMVSCNCAIAALKSSLHLLVLVGELRR